MERKVAEYEVESHGVDHAQYFHGSSAEEYDDSALGVGWSEREAFEDAMESLAQNGWTWDAEPDALEFSDVDEVESHRPDAFEDPCDAGEPCPTCEASNVNGVNCHEAGCPTWRRVRESRREQEECELYFYVTVRVSAARAEVRP